MTSRCRRVAVVPLVVISLASAKPPARPAVYDPDPSRPGAGALQGETWSRESPTAALWLTRIDDETRAGFLKRRSGLAVDPFAATPGRGGGGFLAFHVLVENRSEARLVFQPQACRLRTSGNEYEAPVDLPTILSAYALADREAPAGIEKIGAAIIDGEVVLRPGERRDGLLVFHAVDPATKAFQVDVDATLARGDPFGFGAFYRKRKK